MKYYKMINTSDFAGIVTSNDLRMYQQKHNLLLGCDEENAQYAQYNDALYHANWMKPVTTDVFSYTDVEIIEIEEDEYNILAESIETGEEINIPESEEETEDITESDPADEATIEYVREAKINAMSNACESTIVAGFDIVLSDEQSHHFSLELTDQIMISALALKASSGADNLPWHADGEACQFYSTADILAINDAMESLITCNQTYFNSLKIYILSLDNIVDISAVSYGQEIPEKYQSDVYKALLNESN